jgi:hypothetical protein
LDPEERSSGPGKLEKGKSQKKNVWGSGKLHALRTLNDALIIMRITTGWAYLWHLKDHSSTGEKQSSQYKQEMKMKDLTG